MAVAAIVFTRDMGELAQLHRGQRAVRNGDPQHVGVKLKVDAVHQPQRLELVLAQLAPETALNLIAKFAGAFTDQCAIDIVIGVHTFQS